MDKAQAQRVNAAHTAILNAGRRGAISPRRALYWAREIAAGRAAPGLVDTLKAPPHEATAARAEFRAAQGDISQQVMDILLQLSESVARLTGDQEDQPPDSWNWPAIFPQYNQDEGWPPLETEGSMTGGPGGHYPVTRPAQNWDGYVAGRSASEAAAEARRRAGQPADPGPISDREADRLFAPRTDAEAQHRAREVAAGQLLDYDDDELRTLLFGDHTFAPGEEG